ncbi:MAG: hypothetical protein COV34_00620 [Candidatus Zambryskibacteria bacterium CG10_big_fil_rev_8_21_14_0_10_42_12]|uniref:Uncharacterized protein n=1 Tax=Candidatus Zambryskibacteria bacterium CG10_big_fil_rev_8_21_14_0_10_42_12 TaxID=1975115 RepID=A0A2H0QX20_9BACT|nr:MAG: hypothetical protein COV34_00620 [Candidatus Zambryskibacteria bacterium CG10_big_fil_rev_8_21_14_0_10_42_12]
MIVDNSLYSVSLKDIIFYKGSTFVKGMKDNPVNNFFKFFFGFWGLIVLSLIVIGIITVYEYSLDSGESVVEASS